MGDLRKLIDHLEHIEKGGEFIRELDPRAGRIVSKPVVEGEIGRKIGSTIGGVFGDKAAKFGGNLGDKAGDFLDKLNPFSKDSDKPESNKPNPNAPGNISDFPSGSGDTKLVPINTPGGQTTAGKNPGKNTNGNNGHDGSGIDPNDDPEDPKTWPPGVKPAPGFGYLDPSGMWIPTPFNIRGEDGNFSKTPTNHPARLTGIPMNQWTPFQQKLDKLRAKHTSINSALIEQSKPVNLPSGAPVIPGYKQVDVKKFSTNVNQGVGPTDIYWVYAYQNGKNIILIGPRLFYNMKLSIGRHYKGWGPDEGIRDGFPKVSTDNGPMHVSAADFNVNDMILNIVVHASAEGIGTSILKSIKI